MTMVKTSDLRKGDLILHNGCTMEMGEMSISQVHKPNEYGAVYWSKAKVLTCEETDIPASWFDYSEGDKTWLIQGNDLATWNRIEGVN